MKKLFLFIFLGFIWSNVGIANGIKEFELEGISIGDSLLDHLSKKEITDEIEANKSRYNHLNNDFGEVYSFNKFETYHSLSFFVKPNDEKFLIYEIQGLISYIEDLNGCHKKQNEIVEEISDLFEDAKKSKQSFKSRADPSGKSTKDKIKFTFNSGDEIQVVCTNWEENLRIKNNWTEGLSIIISTNGVINWLRGN
jgi:hypothetical protein